MKNHEGYPDPAANETINGVRREEKQRLLEKKVRAQAWTKHRNL